VATETDLLVLGGGPGGYTAAIRAAQLGVDTTLVERAAYGGTCLNDGCIPSKALLSATKRVADIRDADAMGIHADPTVDADTLFDWVEGIVTDMSASVRKLCLGNGVDLVEGEGRFLDGETLAVEDERIRFEHAVVATGSQPVALPGVSFEQSGVRDAAAAFAWERLPEQLVVVGAGYIGMELAGAFATLGVDVTVVEEERYPLVAYERDLVRPVKKALEARGVEFVFEARAEAWTGEAVRVTTPDGTRSMPGDSVLVAVGREPRTAWGWPISASNAARAGLSQRTSGWRRRRRTCSRSETPLASHCSRTRPRQRARWRRRRWRASGRRWPTARYRQRSLPAPRSRPSVTRKRRPPRPGWTRRSDSSRSTRTGGR
jgi:dihydrolipoamide dehydrogenase